ncbi:MAG: hypothetical protein ACI85O_002321 [Saprospiraceae bacterium]|jgi:hypothetical protein
MNTNSKTLNNIIFWVAGLALLTYSTIRACTIQITIDEATTYLTYGRHNLWHIYSNVLLNTNNHFLNSFLVFWSTKAFGFSLFTVRLPALLAHLMYIVFSFKFLQEISSRTIVLLAGIAFLHLNPYYIEFFGLARGYGLGFAMMMASMYYFLLYIKNRKASYITWSFLFAGLSVYSLLILLNYFVALIAAFNFIYLQDYWKAEKRPSFFLSFFEKNKAALYVSVILYALLAIPISMVKNSNEFFGERHNFYEDSIRSITEVSLYGNKYIAPDIYMVLIGITAIIFLGIIIYAIRAMLKQKTTPLITTGFAFCLLFFIFCLSTIVQFNLLDIPYLYERTALPYIPLFGVLPAFFLAYLKNKKRLQFVLCLLPILAFTYHFSQCANIKQVKEWWFERDTLTALNYIEEHEKLRDIEGREERPRFGTTSWNSPAFHFHIIEGNLKKKLTPYRRDILTKDDLPEYYYLWFDNLKKIDRHKYELLIKLKYGVLLKLKEEYSLPKEED